MTTYTILEAGTATSGMSAADAAHELLTYDGHEYDIRREDDHYALYISNASRNSCCYKGVNTKSSVVTSFEDDEDAAHDEIFNEVIACGHWRNDNMDCLADESYAEHLKQLAEE